ncbi:uncharacterized protein PV07_00130 [Cladophialophora immunda]|uniref:Amino acid permease/ SLC12A domain-containing protein n=1 Tax=Cladophialophora immunda TaxID=569365 RepID=A0A0D2CPU7_9EURO|nr:uncharacterized protein PV07_00130 [Cladophialophora immunda]KIW33263.1 hypothetical protein PV07_00130 [Cladophialophora immunda]OQV11218.1 hypothetical protein CLAIMM_15081 isoform 1 [Cladophialophora immunda]OQV11219.1 hypothetical protein CLAIMM_15081 isoform 2 [Cladophialophora immunda]OQV11220.1 hypothetical protein CLAIMM_15081 isoform 3 [Cladophialophora immunda]
MSKSESPRIAELPDDEADALQGSHVPPKYRGTAIDRQDMKMLGKKQVLRRQFRFSTMLGFASTVMVAWEFVLVVSPFGLSDGGTPAVFWGLLLSPIVMLPVYASLAEVASMSPTAGGQYHWVSELAPPRFQRGLSYSVGWLIALGWQVFLCSVSFEVSTLILGLATLNFPGYTILAWHETLLTIAIVVFCVLFNIFLAVRLPLIEAVVLILHVLGVFVIIIPLWVMAPRGNAHETILHITNDSGYSDEALAATIGFVPMIGMLIGYDCTIHMSEETQDASRTIPLVVVWAVASNALMLIVVGWTYIFCLGDLDSVLNSATGQPMIQVFYNATRSHVGTSIMVVVVIVIFISACVGQVATASRQMWSFARDKGFPGSYWLEKVPSRWNIPLNAIFVSAIITSLLSLINLGSYTAFNAFNSLGTVSILFSYTITIGCLIWRRLYGKPLPPRRWSLGRWGLPVNIISLCFTTPMLFFYTWPLYHPVNAQNMNWSSTMFFGVLIIAAIYYIFKGRHEYVGPVVHVKREE